jgi:Lrp/AsnC family leucine-responsive transcriptional regulator
MTKQGLHCHVNFIRPDLQGRWSRGVWHESLSSKNDAGLFTKIHPIDRIKITMPTETQDIDRTDRRILDLLQRDGRISNLKLAEAVSLSPTAVLARVQRLTREGFILGYEARLNPLKLGAGMMVFVEILLDRTSPNVFEQFKAAVQVRPEIMECHMVAGGFDYLLKTRAADMNAYRQFAGTVLWQLPGVRETRTYAVMEEVKNTTALAL